MDFWHPPPLTQTNGLLSKEWHSKKVEEHANEVWDKLGLTQEKLDELANIHDQATPHLHSRF